MKRLFACAFILVALTAPTLASAANALLIVNLSNGTTIQEIATAYEVDYVDHTAGGPFVLYSVDEARKALVEAAMSTDARIVWVEDDMALDSPEDERPEDIRAGAGGTIPAIFDTAAGAYFNQNYLRQINWRSTGRLLTDRTIRVAVLDTGLSPYQPNLWINVIASYDAMVPTNEAASGSPYDVPYGVDTNLNGVDDDAVGHGTFVTSIIATVAPYAKLAIARVADSDGAATSWTIIKGIVFAVDSGCELANISLGSVDQPTALGDVIEWAGIRGLVVIAGAGNDNTDRALFPSRFSDVICVAGVDLDDHKAVFSNWDGKVRQSAPAVEIAGAWWKGGMVGWSGTSFASPFVTACLADTARKRPFWSPSRVRDLCNTTGKNIDPQNPLYEGELGLRLDWASLMMKQNRTPQLSGRG